MSDRAYPKTIFQSVIQNGRWIEHKHKNGDVVTFDNLDYVVSLGEVWCPNGFIPLVRKNGFNTFLARIDQVRPKF